MEIKIVNNIAGAKISMDKAADNTVVITVEEQTIRLGDVKPGATVKIGGREYIVLDHSKDTTAVITKDPWRSMEFGDSGNYAESAVRNALNKEFLSEVSSAVGVESIIEHVSPYGGSLPPLPQVPPCLRFLVVDSHPIQHGVPLSRLLRLRRWRAVLGRLPLLRRRAPVFDS